MNNEGEGLMPSIRDEEMANREATSVRRLGSRSVLLLDAMLTIQKGADLGSDLPGGWALATLGEVCEPPQNGYSLGDNP